MAALNPTTFDYALKRKYPQQRIEKMFYEMCPTFAMLPKGTNFGGEALRISLKYGAIPSISAGFSSAQDNKSHTSGSAFLVTRVKKYAIGAIDNETIKASKGNENALISAASSEMEDAINTLGQVAADELFGNGSGSIGSVDSPGSNPILTLENKEDVRHFEIGQKLVLAADAASALRDAGAVGTVNAVNRTAGTLDMAANVTTTWPNASGGDLIFRLGDYASASDRNCITGFAGYLPGSASPSALFGMTRTTDVTRQAGVYSNESLDPGLNNEEVPQLLAQKVVDEKGRPDLYIINSRRYRELTTALGSKVTYDKVVVPLRDKNGKTVGKIGFNVLVIAGPRGDIKVLSEPACPYKKAYMLQTNTWKFQSLGAMPGPVLLNGQYLRDSHDSDGVELRVGYYGNLTCTAPGWNGVYTWS